MKNLPSHLPRTTKRVDMNKRSVEGGSVHDDERHIRLEVDDGYCNGDDTLFGVVDEEGKMENPKSFVVDLMGMAKPAKPRGKQD